MVAQTVDWSPEPWVQSPAFFTHPEFDYSAGYRIADFISDLRLNGHPFVPDPDQRNLLAAMFAGPVGATYQSRHLKWASSTVAVVAPRQNLKTAVMQMGVLGAALILGARKIIWTAHQFNPAARDTFRDLQQILDENPAVGRGATITTASGREAIQFGNGSRIEFLARSKGAGRSLSADVIVLDEAFALSTAEVGALLPTRSARPNSQVWYASSAGRLESDQLRITRDRGRAGTRRMTYAEWCGRSAFDEDYTCREPGCSHEFGTPGCVLDDRQEWQRANPALGRRIDWDTVEDERAQMSAVEFARERLGWWDQAKGGAVIPLAKWSPLGTQERTISGQIALMVDVTLNRSHAVIGVCGDAGGVPQVEIGSMGEGTDWVVEKVDRMLADHEVLAVGARSAGPVASLLPDLRGVCKDAGVDFVKVGSTDFGGQCGAFYDAVMSGSLRHMADPRIDGPLAAARKHQVLDAWTWERSRLPADADAAPLVAVTGAHALYAQYARVTVSDPLQNIW